MRHSPVLCLKHLFTVIVISALASAGCSSRQGQDPLADYPQEITRFSIVSLAQPGYSIAANSSIGWHPAMFKRLPAQDPSMQEASELLDDILAQSITRKGIQFTPWLRARPDYWLAYRVVLDDSLSGDVMVQQFGMAPGFAMGEAQDYEKGTLVMDLVQRRSNRTIWRSSAQGLVAPDLPTDIRRLRLQSAIDQMLSSLPIS